MLIAAALIAGCGGGGTATQDVAGVIGRPATIAGQTITITTIAAGTNGDGTRYLGATITASAGGQRSGTGTVTFELRCGEQTGRGYLAGSTFPQAATVDADATISGELQLLPPSGGCAGSAEIIATAFGTPGRITWPVDPNVVAQLSP